MKKIINSLKTINYKMFFALFIFGLIPTLYTTFRIYLIGQLPNTYGFSIAGQLHGLAFYMKFYRGFNIATILFYWCCYI